MENATPNTLLKSPLYLRMLGLGKAYFVKTPWWLKRCYPSRVWDVPTTEKILYLSFDDGPHPECTPFVLDELKKYNAKASFFCIGKNVEEYPLLYNRILEEGHAVGNHTQHHLNGWQTDDETYLDDFMMASKNIHSSLFRPPYGRIKNSQAKKLKKGTHIVMWSVLSGDFDPAMTGERCYENVVSNVSEGSIVVFHDSDKAFPLLQYALPRVLEKLSEEGYRFDKLSL